MGMAKCSLNFFHNFFIPDLFSWIFQFSSKNMLIPAGPIPAVHADIFHTASILLAVKANFYERKRRKDKVCKCCRFLGFYAGEEVILDESSISIPDPELIPEQRSFFLSSIGSFLTKNVFFLSEPAIPFLGS